MECCLCLCLHGHHLTGEPAGGLSHGVVEPSHQLIAE